MENAFEIIVVILSVFLGLFLVLGIIFLIFAIKVILIVKRVTAKAEHLADKAEALGEFVQKAAPSLMVARFFNTFAGTMFKKKSKRK